MAEGGYPAAIRKPPLDEAKLNCPFRCVGSKIGACGKRRVPQRLVGNGNVQILIFKVAAKFFIQNAVILVEIRPLWRVRSGPVVQAKLFRLCAAGHPFTSFIIRFLPEAPIAEKVHPNHGRLCRRRLRRPNFCGDIRPNF